MNLLELYKQAYINKEASFLSDSWDKYIVSPFNRYLDSRAKAARDSEQWLQNLFKPDPAEIAYSNYVQSIPDRKKRKKAFYDSKGKMDFLKRYRANLNQQVHKLDSTNSGYNNSFGFDNSVIPQP